MSGWDDFKTDASKVCSKVVAKTGELADTASAHVRMQSLKLKLCEEFEKLGRLTYKSEKSGETENLAGQIEKIDKIRSDIDKLQKTIDSKKQQE